MSFETLLPVFLTALVGSAVPAAIAVWAAFKASAAKDGVADWKDYLVDVVDQVVDQLEDEGDDPDDDLLVADEFEDSDEDEDEEDERPVFGDGSGGNIFGRGPK